MQDLMTRMKEGLSKATDTAKRKVSETKHKIDRKLNTNLFEGIIAGCVLIMNTSLGDKTAQDRINEEHNLLISLAEKGITNYFSQEEITNALTKYMSIFETGNFVAGYGMCIATIAQLKKESDITELIRFMYDVSAADGTSDPVERQVIADVAGFLGYKNYAVVEPELTGHIPFKMTEGQRQIGGRRPPTDGSPSLPPPAPKTQDNVPPPPPDSRDTQSKGGQQDKEMPDWMKK
ncbi:hypothetical protein QUF76_09870 [Desulfobacterales bacterium HSG16]|nr:hypothetical protein [Desulfobacterales bacterium HSG16]